MQIGTLTKFNFFLFGKSLQRIENTLMIFFSKTIYWHRTRCKEQQVYFSNGSFDETSAIALSETAIM